MSGYQDYKTINELHKLQDDITAWIQHNKQLNAYRAPADDLSALAERLTKIAAVADADTLPPREGMMTERLENDQYVYPGQRFAQNGLALGHGQGMTLRDWFAGQALASLAGVACNDGSDFLHPLGVKSAAQWAYSFADAMLTARTERG